MSSRREKIRLYSVPFPDWHFQRPINAALYEIHGGSASSDQDSPALRWPSLLDVAYFMYREVFLHGLGHDVRLRSCAKRAMLKIFTPAEGHKPRLSSKFSWPIGLDALSGHLADVPQAEEMRVWFSDRPRDDRPHQHQWSMERIADKGDPYQICSVWYLISGRNAKWYLMIYPVERRLRSDAKRLLETGGLARIHGFLSHDHTETELMVDHHFRCIFDPVNRTLSYEHETG